MKKPWSVAPLLIMANMAMAEVTVDNCGEPLVFDHTPERLVVHDMNMTEMAFALGLQDKIVGLTGIRVDDRSSAHRSCAFSVTTQPAPGSALPKL